MKILLINLPAESAVRDFTTSDYILADFMRYPPLGLLAIAADVDKRHSLRVLDVTVRDMSIDDVVEYILRYEPDVLGISVVTRLLYAMREICRRVKETNSKIIIIVGGPHINYFPNETMQLGNIDFALTGYCEKSFPALIELLDGGRLGSELIDTIHNLYYKSRDGQTSFTSTDNSEESLSLDYLPFPDRQLINLSDYYTVADKVKMTSLYSSRGCPFPCIYCDVQEKKFRFRSPMKVVDEFEEITRLGIREVHIFDDSFNIIRQRVIDICNDILRRNIKVRWSARVRVAPFDTELASLMKRAGCVRLHIGVESLDEDILRFIKKGITLEEVRSFFKICNGLKIDTLVYFMLGFPGETKKYRMCLFNEARRLKPTYMYFNLLCPLPRTKYYEWLLREGIYKFDFWSDFIRNPTSNFEIPYPRDAKLQRELEVTVDRYHRRIFLNPGFILRETKRSIANPSVMFRKARAALMLLSKATLRNPILRERYGD